MYKQLVLLVSLRVRTVRTLTAVDICRALAVSTGNLKKQQGVIVVCAQLGNLKQAIPLLKCAVSSDTS